MTSSKMMPRQPTPAMKAAAQRAAPDALDDEALRMYEAMYDAAPQRQPDAWMIGKGAHVSFCQDAPGDTFPGWTPLYASKSTRRRQ